VKEQYILDLPAYPGPRYNGSAIKLGPGNNSLNVTMGDGYLYIVSIGHGKYLGYHLNTRQASFAY
jgi:hypothetical protein